MTFLNYLEINTLKTSSLFILLFQYMLASQG